MALSDSDEGATGIRAVVFVVDLVRLGSVGHGVESDAKLEKLESRFTGRCD